MAEEYNKDHCWQYEIRLRNTERDLENCILSKEEIDNINISDIELKGYTLSEDRSEFDEAKQFIETHEWLGKLSQYPTHLFTARYKGVLCGVVFHDMPIVFSNILGKDYKHLERLISRGACISFSPKGLASRLIMFSIRWSVQNTRYRFFSGYSDTGAKELGTVYQACNFIYLGQKFGSKKQFKSPQTGRWISDRSFRSRSAYKRYAKDLGIEWYKEWNTGDKVHWELIPDDIEQQLRERSKIVMGSCESKPIPLKHKYIQILGKDKRETKALKKLFVEHGGTLNLSYPKER